MVTPDLKAGAYAVEGRFRRSHFTIKGSNFVFAEAPSGAGASDRLFVVESDGMLSIDSGQMT